MLSSMHGSINSQLRELGMSMASMQALHTPYLVPDLASRLFCDSLSGVYYTTKYLHGANSCTGNWQYNCCNNTCARVKVESAETLDTRACKRECIPAARPFANPTAPSLDAPRAGAATRLAAPATTPFAIDLSPLDSPA